MSLGSWERCSVRETAGELLISWSVYTPSTSHNFIYIMNETDWSVASEFRYMGARAELGRQWKSLMSSTADSTFTFHIFIFIVTHLWVWSIEVEDTA